MDWTEQQKLLTFLSDHQHTEHIIGRIDARLARALSSQSTTVKIRKDYAIKLLSKHNLHAGHLMEVQQALLTAPAVIDRPRHLSFFHSSSLVEPHILQITIKVTESGNELWLATMHLQRQTYVDRIMQKRSILRVD